MATAEKVVILKKETRGTLPAVEDRDFWVAMRHTLLMQLAAIEKKLGLSRRCKHCGNTL